MRGMLIPIDTLGAEIKARIEAGEKALDKAEQHYIAAGIQLAAAKKRLSETREMRFSAFLFSCCKGMSESRAYELIALGDGRTSLAEIRAKGAERAARHAEKNRQARSEKMSVTNGETAVSQIALSTSTAGATEIEELKVQLARAQETIKDLRSKLVAREDMVAIAMQQSKEAHTRAMFATADKERLTEENDRLKENSAIMHDLVMHGGSREGLVDENGDEIGGDVFVIGACQSAMKAVMIMEPFWPLTRDDVGNLKTFLGLNRADWKEAKPELIRLTGMQEAVDLWNIEYARGLESPEPDWPVDEWDCLQERYCRAGIVTKTDQSTLAA